MWIISMGNYGACLFWLGIWCEWLVWVIMWRQEVSQNAGILVVLVVNWTLLRSKLQWIWNENRKLFIHENAFEYVSHFVHGRWGKIGIPTLLRWHLCTVAAHSVSLVIMGAILPHYSDVIMGTVSSQITSLTIVYSTVYSDEDQRTHQSSASLAFVRGIHRGPVNSPHKWPVTRKIFPFDDIIMRSAHDRHTSLALMVKI